MNADRRKQIKATLAEIEEITEMRDALVERIGEVQSDEEAARENLPESLQDGEAGSKMQEAIDALGEAAGELENIDFQSTLDALETAGA